MVELKQGDCCMWCEHSRQNGKWCGDYYFTYCNHPDVEGNIATHNICDNFIKMTFLNGR